MSTVEKSSILVYMTIFPKLCALAVGLCLIAACNATPTPSIENTPPAVPLEAGKTSIAPLIEGTVQLPHPDNGPVMTLSLGTLTVNVFSETDVEVAVPEYPVTGSAPAGTVLSVNDEIMVVDDTQTFTVIVPLEEGPNLVEITASNADGDEVSFFLTVTYTIP